MLQNTFGAICLHVRSNSNPFVGQFVDALKTVIISGLAFRSLLNPNCYDDDDDDGATLLEIYISLSRRLLFLRPVSR